MINNNITRIRTKHRGVEESPGVDTSYIQAPDGQDHRLGIGLPDRFNVKDNARSAPAQAMHPMLYCRADSRKMQIRMEWEWLWLNPSSTSN